MLIGFIGCPCSGKTTTAAKLFAALKADGISTEFIVEQARWYIAQKRLRSKGPLVLTDDDQFRIMLKQYQIEQTFKAVCPPETLIISDTTALSAMLYMTAEQRESQEVQQLCYEAVKLYDVIYTASPVLSFDRLDSNRVHDEQQSRAIAAKIEPLLASVLPTSVPVVPLVGSIEIRFSTVLRDVLLRFGY